MNPILASLTNSAHPESGINSYLPIDLKKSPKLVILWGIVTAVALSQILLLALLPTIPTAGFYVLTAVLVASVGLLAATILMYIRHNWPFRLNPIQIDGPNFYEEYKNYTIDHAKVDWHRMLVYFNGVRIRSDQVREKYGELALFVFQRSIAIPNTVNWSIYHEQVNLEWKFYVMNLFTSVMGPDAIQEDSFTEQLSCNLIPNKALYFSNTHHLVSQNLDTLERNYYKLEMKIKVELPSGDSKITLRSPQRLSDSEVTSDMKAKATTYITSYTQF